MKNMILKNSLLFLVTVAFSAILSAIAVAGQVVLFDQGHGQRFLVEKGGALDLSRLADLFAERGMVVSW